MKKNYYGYVDKDDHIITNKHDEKSSVINEIRQYIKKYEDGSDINIMSDDQLTDYAHTYYGIVIVTTNQAP